MRCRQISDLTQSSVTSVIFNVKLHSSRHPCCQYSVTSYLFSVITQFLTSAARCRQISDLTQLSMTPVISMFSYIHLDISVVYIRSHLTSSPLLPNFPSPQCVAGKFPISHRYLRYSYDVAFIHDIRDVMFSFNLTLPCYYPISDFTHHP